MTGVILQPRVMCTLATAGWVARKRATSMAFSQWRCMRRAKVLSPRLASQEFKRAGDASQHLNEIVEGLLDVIGVRADHGTAGEGTMTGEELGGGMNHNIGSEAEWSLAVGGGEGIIHSQPGTRDGERSLPQLSGPLRPWLGWPGSQHMPAWLSDEF